LKDMARPTPIPVPDQVRDGTSPVNGGRKLGLQLNPTPQNATQRG
jgi:hypothetical protein